MTLAFKKATKRQSRLRMALIGPSGSGKTYTALRVAQGLGSKIAVIDTERGSAAKYADQFEFDALELEEFDPRKYVDAIHAAEAAGYDVLVIDSLSHAWMGKGGALEIVDQKSKSSKSGNSYMAWRDVTPIHNALVDAILRSRCHVIATMRTKTEYVIESVNGKQTPRKVGMAPVQRDGMEYEFDILGDMTLDHDLIVSKTRYSAIADTVISKPGQELGKTLADWLSDGAPAIERPTLVAAPADETDGLDTEPDDVDPDERRKLEHELKGYAMQAKVSLLDALRSKGYATLADLPFDHLEPWIARLKKIVDEMPVAEEPAEEPDPERITNEDRHVLQALWDEVKLGDSQFEEFCDRFHVAGFELLRSSQLEDAMAWIRHHKKPRR